MIEEIVKIKDSTLTLKEIKNEISKLNNNLQNKLDLKQINYERATGTTTQMKDIITSKTNFIFDRFSHYAIKDETHDEDILMIQLTLASYEALYFKELERMSKYEDLNLIIYLREEEEMSWKDIDKLLNYSEGVSKVKYSRYKEKKCN